jgi:hypothetical protein
MLWTIIVILVVLWLLGFLGHVGGSLIHLLLVVAVVVLIINLIQGRGGGSESLFRSIRAMLACRVNSLRKGGKIAGMTRFGL